MGKIKMLLDTFLPFKPVIKWDRALYGAYFSCSSQKELTTWGKDSDYAGQRTPKLRKEDREILIKNKRKRTTGYLLPKYMSEKKAGRVHRATKTMSLWHLIFLRIIFTSFLIQGKNDAPVFWRRWWGKYTGENMSTVGRKGVLKEAVHLPYNTSSITLVQK